MFIIPQYYYHAIIANITKLIFVRDYKFTHIFIVFRSGFRNPFSSCGTHSGLRTPFPGLGTNSGLRTLVKFVDLIPVVSGKLYSGCETHSSLGTSSNLDTITPFEDYYPHLIFFGISHSL